MILDCHSAEPFRIGNIERRGEKKKLPSKGPNTSRQVSSWACQSIKSFSFLQVGGAASKWEAVGMFSGDGEYVDFLHSVLLDGPVEVSGGEGLRTKLILFPVRKSAWFHKERTSP